ncbi:hypothetical protein [Acetobacter peroxydans]|uniref:Uncharacterized protein n=1 Tax=Acetobacter peroxydans TaxID=104098 RepID=A0A4Y3TWS5_9PROT|nr:hypothetical protein [Acetobacter peroxydans]NHO17088.1 hypothetical protein [Acetobacter peroxydans]GBR38793.1 hypothetical protein AA13755_2260 [Acetobacter peroxydans NBRC 13755]GBR39608.1 hypothetical protein AA0475_0265 [Acetobacter peroxydans]GEB86302.1 hypothetical protein APE01nite_20990 [Acetobacter peroxydans]
MLQDLLDFAGSIGSAFAIALPTLCYISGSACLLGSLFGLYSRAKGATGAGSSFPVCIALIAAGASLLSFSEFLNMGNATLGLSARTSVGGVNSAGQVTFSADSLKSAISQGPTATLAAMLHVFRYYFMSYGAFWVYVSIMRELNSMKGRSNTSTTTNICMGLGGFFLMNADTIGPALAKKLHLLSS